jgi:hypothetical protein
MRELITIKGTQRACLYGLGVPGLLGLSPPAKSKSKSYHVVVVVVVAVLIIVVFVVAKCFKHFKFCFVDSLYFTTQKMTTLIQGKLLI